MRARRFNIEFLRGPFTINLVLGQQDLSPEKLGHALVQGVLQRVPQIEADIELLTGLRVHFKEVLGAEEPPAKT